MARMSLLRALLWFGLFVGLVTVAMFVTGNFELADRLTGLFVSGQLLLPVTLNFDTFLLIATASCLVVTALVLFGTVALISFMAGRLSIAHQRLVGQAAAAKQEIEHVQTQHLHQYQRLIALGQTLTKRLDKRLLSQAIVQAASGITSVPQANSPVSLWVLHFETDTIRFELGLYCDQGLFARTAVLPTEQPFARVVQTQKPWLVPSWEECGALIRQEKAPLLGSSTSLMVVPLIIESSMLGALLIFCHPDLLKSYEQQEAFYEALWADLSLGLAIAIQGELAILDRLTGAHNREYFMRRLIQEIDRANRYRLPLALLMIDIDNFKAVNDTLGHPQGDAVLKIISRLIKKEVRAIDLVGRYGGEEFIIMLPETGLGDEASSATGALKVAERIRKAVDDEFRGLQKPLALTVSLGVAVRRFPEDRESGHQEMIRLVDEQLYRAKTTGKNRVCALIHENPQEVPSE